MAEPPADRSADEAGAGKAGPGGTRKKAAAGKAAPRRRASGAKRAQPTGGAGAPAGAGTQERTAVTAAHAVEQPGALAATAPLPAESAERGPGRATAVTNALRPVGRVLASQRAPRVRSWLALILVVMAVLAVIVSVVALWSRDLVFNTDTYVKTVAPIADDPQVRHAVSVYVTDKAITATDLNQRIESALPSDAKILAAPLTSDLRRFLVDEIDKFLGTKLARDIWVDINRFGHQQLITALQDQNRYVTVGQNDVKLNLLPLVAVALQKLEDQIPRLLGKDVQLPRIDPTTAPEEIRILLQDALGRPLPADFGSITVLRGDQGYEAKRALSLFKDLVMLVVVVAVALVVAALLVSVRKRRTALQLGLGVLLAFVVARVIERQGEKAIAATVKNESGVAVAKSIVSSAIASLNAFFAWVVVAAVVLTVAAILASKPEWLEAMGRGVAKLFGVASDLSAPNTGAGRWMAAHLDLLRVGGVIAAVVVLFFIAGSLTAVLTAVVVLVVYELVLVVYAVGLPRTTDGEPQQPAV